ncbi:serine/threonine-protein kinase [Nannocystis exedens]|uniref:serine/threonine-protein kinase n=1 Tax=Nannocystis exedens TaxID=54 RepID=UPI003B8311E4
MGVVYTAFDELLGRAVAIKTIRADRAGPSATARILHEALALARLSHPNVVQIHDASVRDGQIFLAMEYVKGCSLRAWLTAAPRPEPAALLDLFIQAGRGLAATHAEGLVHRDFKPDNVLVGDDGRVRVVDFGLVASTRGDARASALDEPAPSDSADRALTRRPRTRATPRPRPPAPTARRPATIGDGPSAGRAAARPAAPACRESAGPGRRAGRGRARHATSEAARGARPARAGRRRAADRCASGARRARARPRADPRAPAAPLQDPRRGG